MWARTDEVVGSSASSSEAKPKKHKMSVPGKQDETNAADNEITERADDVTDHAKQKDGDELAESLDDIKDCNESAVGAADESVQGAIEGTEVTATSDAGVGATGVVELDRAKDVDGDDVAAAVLEADAALGDGSQQSEASQVWLDMFSTAACESQAAGEGDPFASGFDAVRALLRRASDEECRPTCTVRSQRWNFQ
jgi:hypothetical protein